MTLTCPKCTSEMRSYERNQVLVDQCTGCGGLFLDRGELEKLTAAENAWHAQSAPLSAPQSRPQDRSSDDRRSDDRRYDDRRHEGYHKPHKKQKSFLSELFD